MAGRLWPAMAACCLAGAMPGGAPAVAQQAACPAPRNFDRDLPPGEIHFATGSEQLDRRARAILRRQAEWLARLPGLHIVLEGHADDRGARDNNRRLSERRARAAWAYLRDLGLSADRMTATGYGEERPVSVTLDPNGRARNRRVITTIRDDEAPIGGSPAL